MLNRRSIATANSVQQHRAAADTSLGSFDSFQSYWANPNFWYCLSLPSVALFRLGLEQTCFVMETANRKVLFVNHKSRRCGVYMFGIEIAQQLAISKRYDFQLVECDSASDLADRIAENRPVALVLNHHFITMPWGPSVASSFALPTVGIVHDATSEMADQWRGPLFDVLVTHDPDLSTSNSLFIPASRPLPQYQPRSTPPSGGPIRIGSFGFAAADKGFEELVPLAAASFDRCIVRLHIPPSDFGDRNSANANSIIEVCRSAARKYPRVAVEVSREFLDRDQVIEFLASNHLNALLYAPDRGEGGISSASDWLLAAGRPFALRRGKMFRHLSAAEPSIFVDDSPLHVILANGTAPVDQFRERWSPQSIVAVYEHAVDRAVTLLLPCEGNPAALRRRASLLVDAEAEGSAYQRLKRNLDDVSVVADNQYRALKAASVWGEEQIARIASQQTRIQVLEREKIDLEAQNKALLRQAIWSPLRYAMAIAQRRSRGS